MPQFITNVTQGSDEWKRLRMGKATASNFDRILSEKTGKYSETQAGKYAREVAIQRLLIEETERPLDGLYWVERGKAMEPAAAQHYEKVRGRTLDQIGLIISDDNTMACSPDRLAMIPDKDWDGDLDTLKDHSHLCGVEIKVPSTETHLEYTKIFRNGEELYDYRWQLLGSIYISHLDEWDFCSFNPRLTEAIRTYHRRQYEDEIATLTKALKRFEGEVKEYCEIMRDVGFVEIVSQMNIRSNEEWQKMIEADPNLWAFG